MLPRPFGRSPRAFGHFGYGGSLGFADPTAEIAFGYVMNRMGTGLVDPRAPALVDAVRAIVALSTCDEARGEIFNIGSTNEVAILELAHRILKLAVDGAGPSAAERIVFIPYEVAYEAGFEDMRRRVPDTTKLAKATGWSPTTTLDETLSRVIAYYQAGADKV